MRKGKQNCNSPPNEWDLPGAVIESEAHVSIPAHHAHHPPQNPNLKPSTAPKKKNRLRGATENKLREAVEVPSSLRWWSRRRRWRRRGRPHRPRRARRRRTGKCGARWRGRIRRSGGRAADKETSTALGFGGERDGDRVTTKRKITNLGRGRSGGGAGAGGGVLRRGSPAALRWHERRAGEVGRGRGHFAGGVGARRFRRRRDEAEFV